MGREALATSVVPSIKALMPTPEPPPVTWTTASGFSSMKASAQRWLSISNVSEPFTCIVPPTPAVSAVPFTAGLQPPRERASAATAADAAARTRHCDFIISSNNEVAKIRGHYT